MLKIYIALCVVALLIACEEKAEEVENCNVDKPIEEITWLNQLRDSCKLVSQPDNLLIYEANYKNQTVYYTNFICPACRMMFGVSLANCQGDTIRIYKHNEAELFQNEVTNQKIIYSCYPIEN